MICGNVQPYEFVKKGNGYPCIGSRNDYAPSSTAYGGSYPSTTANPVFMTEQEPSRLVTQNYCPFNNQCPNTESYTYLNQRGVKPSPYFEKTKLPYVTERNGTERTVFASTKQDGRLVDTSRNYTMKLDVPPIQVVYDLIHDNMDGSKELAGYGKGYATRAAQNPSLGIYGAVNGGQIQYYIDKDIAQPFLNPVYGFPAESTGRVWRDPQGTFKPQFEKKFDTSRLKHTEMLSSIEDTTKFRDDIISKQQRTHNEQRYDLVHGRFKI